MPPRRLVVVAMLVFIASFVPRSALAFPHQLTLGPDIGFAITSSARGGIGGVVGLNGAYGLSDTWRIYANFQYGLEAANAANTPRNSFALAAGLAYVLDVLTITPWVGAGIQGAVVVTPTWVGVIPLVEIRGGADYIVNHDFAITAQVAYGLAFLNRDVESDSFTATLGVRWVLNL